MDVSKALNIMRIPMAFWVVWFHSYISNVREPMTYDFGFLLSNIWSLPSIFLNDTPFLGVIAVNIFIIISGFGLTYSHYRKKPITLRKYFKKRFVRIMPIYWIALAFAILWNVVVLHYIPSWFSIFTHILGIHVFFPTTLYDINGSLWFVGLLIPFYITFPWMVKIYESKYGFWKLVALGILAKLLIGMFIYSDSSNPPKLWLEFLADFALGMHLAKRYVVDGIKKIQTSITTPAIFLSISVILISRSSYIDLHSLQAPYLHSIYAVTVFFGIIGLFNLFPRVSRKISGAKIYKIILATVLEIYLFHSPLVDYVKYGHPNILRGDPTRTFIFALVIFIILGSVIALFQTLPAYAHGYATKRKTVR